MGQLKNESNVALYSDILGIYQCGRIFYLENPKKWQEFQADLSQFTQLCFGFNEVQYHVTRLENFLKRRGDFSQDVNFASELLIRFGNWNDSSISRVIERSGDNSFQAIYLGLLEYYSRWWPSLHVKRPDLWNKRSCLGTEITPQGRNVILWPLRLFFRTHEFALRTELMEHFNECKECLKTWLEWKVFYYEYLKESRSSWLRQLSLDQSQFTLDELLKKEFERWFKQFQRPSVFQNWLPY